MIGLKCAECLAEKVSEITVCDLADHVLPTFLDFECASYVQKRLEDHGIRFALGDSVEHFGKDPSSGKNEAVLKNGTVLQFDVLVLAIGARANASLVKDIGGAGERGIAVDEYMQTSILGIYAAGDNRTKSVRQLVTAAADGAVAATEAVRFVQEH